MQLTSHSTRVCRDIRTLLIWVHSHVNGWMEVSPPSLEVGLADYRVCRARLHLIALEARSVGLLAYASLCVRLGEQLEPLFRVNHLPRSAMRLLWLWSKRSLGYLDLVSDDDHSIELVALLDLAPLRGQYGEQERAMLVSGLIDDRIRLTTGNKTEVNQRSHSWSHQ